jgi:uncharacterized membrane protein
MTIRQAWSDRRIEILLAHVLRTGVSASAAVVLIGGAVYLARHGGEVPDYRVFRGEPATLRSVHGIFADARALSGRGLIQLGLLMLMATPVARVLFSLVGFLFQRDWLYLAITTIVISLLAYGLFGGAG